MRPMLRRAVTAGSASASGSANYSEMRIFSRWLSCTSLSYVRVSRSCSTLDSIDTGMLVRWLISLSVQRLRERSERSRLPSVD